MCLLRVCQCELQFFLSQLTSPKQKSQKPNADVSTCSRAGEKCERRGIQGQEFICHFSILLESSGAKSSHAPPGGTISFCRQLDACNMCLGPFSFCLLMWCSNRLIHVPTFAEDSISYPNIWRPQSACTPQL